MSTELEQPTSTELLAPSVYEHLSSVVTSLWFEIDHNGGERAHHFFAPDAELRFSDAVFTGRDEIAEVYANRSARGSRVSRHIVTNLQFYEMRPDFARATSICFSSAKTGSHRALRRRRRWSGTSLMNSNCTTAAG